MLHGIDLAIEDREFVVFVGPSGCGKSTLLRLIAGLEDITAGDLFIGKTRVNALQPARRRVAMVFQSYALYPHMTVYQNMAFGLQHDRIDRHERDRRVREAAESLELTPLLERLPRQLSGGQRQRVAIGRAIVRQPAVFLFDEPLSNLDAALRIQTRLEISRLHRRLDATMIYVTHDQVEAMTLADRIVVLNEGRVEQFGRPLELYHRPANLFVATFLGSPTMNILDATIADVDRNGAFVRQGDTVVNVPADTSDVAVGQVVRLGIRPEHVRLARPETEAMAGVVDVLEALGESHLAHVRLDSDQRLIVRTAGDPHVREGERVGLAFKAQDCHLFRLDGTALLAGVSDRTSRDSPLAFDTSDTTRS